MDEDLLHHRQQQQQHHLPPSAIPARLLSPYALVAEGTKLTLLIVAQAMAILLALTMVVDSITCVRFVTEKRIYVRFSPGNLSPIFFEVE